MKQGFKVIDSELHLEEPFDLWERRLEEPYRSWTQVLPRPRGHLQVGGTRYRFGPQAPQETQGDGASLVARQADRRWPDAPHLVEARTRCSPEVYLEGMDIEGIDVAILTPTMGIGIASRDGLDPGHAVALCRAYNSYAGEFAASDRDRTFSAPTSPGMTERPLLRTTSSSRGMCIGIRMSAWPTVHHTSR